MDEITLYENFRDIAIAHQHTSEWRKANGFGLGYLSDLNTDNLEQSTFRKDYFYSEKWYQSGKNPNKPLLDFPFVMMLPVAVQSEVERNGFHSGTRLFSIVFYVLDLIGYDRNNVKESPYARRSREEIWRDTQAIGEEILMEFNARGFTSQPKYYLGNNGRYTCEKVFDLANRRLAGTQFELQLNMAAGCPKGSFDYSRVFPQQQEKYIP